jgi:hypothetical protein
VGVDGSRFEAGQEMEARKKSYPQMSEMHADKQNKNRVLLFAHLRASAASVDKNLA